MNKEVLINDRSYIFMESFDTNLCTLYENDSWGTWHILREFISNALDAVSGDTSKVKIADMDGYTYIKDEGAGFELKYAKRIGASSKKEDPASIGQFGEGSKLAILTCIRDGFDIRLCSQNWLIMPRITESEGEQIMLYDIYVTDAPISGSLVMIQTTDEVQEIITNLPSYFLHFNPDACLFGDISRGIFPLVSSKAYLYNKGVFIKEVNALYSYNISLEKLNRDRDLLSYSDMAYEIRNLWEIVDNKELIKTLLAVASQPSDIRNNMIEFYARLYSNNPSIWAEAFTDLFGANACIFTSDIAAREASALGFSVVQLDNGIPSILKSAGIRSDSDGLADDYEFEFAHVNKEEKETLIKLTSLAELAGFEIPECINIFDIYKSNPEILGIYNQENCQIYLKKDILSGNLENALHVLLHEANHHETKADDVSREFSDSLSRKLAKLVVLVSNKLGRTIKAEFHDNGLLLPADISLSASAMDALIAVLKNEVIIKVGTYSISLSVDNNDFKPCISKRKVQIKNQRYYLQLPQHIMDAITKSRTLELTLKP